MMGFDPKTFKFNPTCNCTLCRQARKAQGFTFEPGSGAISPMPDDMNPKDKLGAAKPQMGLIPVGAMASVARVMELGAKKYGPYNWRTKKVRAMVYADAALRHLFAWIGGESHDKESGEPHWAHFVACGLIVLDAMAHGTLIDDRTWPTDGNGVNPKKDDLA